MPATHFLFDGERAPVDKDCPFVNDALKAGAVSFLCRSQALIDANQTGAGRVL